MLLQSILNSRCVCFRLCRTPVEWGRNDTIKVHYKIITRYNEHGNQWIRTSPLAPLFTLRSGEEIRILRQLICTTPPLSSYLLNEISSFTWIYTPECPDNFKWLTIKKPIKLIENQVSTVQTHRAEEGVGLRKPQPSMFTNDRGINIS